MKPVLVSAPGKAVLSGEYAVLRGAAAVSVAVDRRARVRISRSDGDVHQVTTPGYAEGQWRFTASDAGEIDWLDRPPPPGLGVVEHGWRACRPRAATGLVIVIDTLDFFAPGRGNKLGFGSSAAAMTAFVAALCQLDEVLADVMGRRAHDAHKAMQHGLGSGVDIATSLHGGVIAFRANTRRNPLHHAWPGGLACRFLWSGRPSDTRQQIDKLRTAEVDEQAWSPLLSAAEVAASAWSTGTVSEILGACSRYADALRRFSADADLGIFEAGHGELADTASSFNVVYKPCGAGGGDIGVALADDETAIERFCERAQTSGFEPLDVALDPRGVSADDGEG